jgi:hypothetical protein
MAGSKDIRAGGAYVELLTKDGALRKGLDNAGKTLQRWGAGVNALGATFLKIGMAAMAPLLATSKVFGDMGDQLAKASTRTGVAVEQLSGLGYAAAQSGSDLEGLETGIKKMQKTLVDAAQGGQGAKDALANLGLTLDDLKGLKPDEQFVTIADALSRVKDPAVKAGLAMQIFGKQGTSLIPLMEGGAAGINALVDEAKRLGLVWSTEDAKAAEEFNDRCDDLFKVLKKGAADIGSALVPILREVAVWVTENVVKVNAWIRAHRETVQLALKVAAGVAAAGAAFLVLGTGLGYVGAAVGGVSSALGAITGAFGGIAKILSAVLFSGIGLVTAGLATLAAYLLYNSEVGQRALGALGGYFDTLKQTASEALGGVMDAMKAGDFALAARVMWLGIKTAFLEGIEPLRVAWAEFKKFFVGVGNDAWGALQAGWEETRNLLTVSWTNTIAFLKDTFNGLIKAFRVAWEETQDFLSRVFIELGVGGLSDEQKKAAEELSNQLNAANKAEIKDEATNAALANLKAKNAALEAEQKRHDAAMAAVGKEANDADAKAKADRDAAIAKAKADAAQAEAELHAATEAARNKNKGGADGGGLLPKAPAFDPNAVANNLDDIAKKTVTVSGTFNSAALSALGGGSVAQQQLDQLKQINKNTKNGGKPGLFS